MKRHQSTTHYSLRQSDTQTQSDAPLYTFLTRQNGVWRQLRHLAALGRGRDMITLLWSKLMHAKACEDPKVVRKRNGPVVERQRYLLGLKARILSCEDVVQLGASVVTIGQPTRRH